MFAILHHFLIKNLYNIYIFKLKIKQLHVMCVLGCVPPHAHRPLAAGMHDALGAAPDDGGHRLRQTRFRQTPKIC